MADVTLTLRLFGALRDHGETAVVKVRVGATASDVRTALAASVPVDAALLAISALATDTEVLPPDVVFDRDAELALLPPVCGG